MRSSAKKIRSKSGTKILKNTYKVLNTCEIADLTLYFQNLFCAADPKISDCFFIQILLL